MYALAVLYAVYLAVKIAKAGDDGNAAKEKEHLKWFIIAFIGTHILIVALSPVSKQMEAWEKTTTGQVDITVEETTKDED